MLQRAGIELALVVAEGDADPGLRQVITYVGAGIYEEALFRLALFSLLVWGLRWAELPTALAVLFAASASATLFSAAHHVGPFGQAYSNYLFVFRLVAGLYFALLYQLRGFGIAVGAHACYNVMVSVT
jgi:membrane protease YdiL (CAAX protease family)